MIDILENKNAKIYYIHDNGGRPFKVSISEIVEVFKGNVNEDMNEVYERDPILTFKNEFGLKKFVFIGKSPENGRTLYSGGYGDEFDGNSILVCLDEKKYVYIGREIYSFESIAKIKKYVSPVGNNDVPYPYAIDENENIYLLLEDVVIKKNAETNLYMETDPYNYYYEISQIMVSGVNYSIDTVMHFRDIKKFRIGKEWHTMTYEVNPAENYDGLVEDIGKMYIIDKHDNKIDLTKETYTELIESFGEYKSFEPIKNITILQKRIW